MKLAKRAGWILQWIFSVKDKAYGQLLKTIAQETDTAYLKWAINCIVKWKGIELDSAIQIHGSKDRTFPLRNAKRPDIILKDAGHFMIVQQAQEIASIIEEKITLGT